MLSQLYQKFLYDYECEREGLSSPSDLQQAIDGNRREGRRNTASATNFTQLNYSLNSSGSSIINKHLNGSIALRNGLEDDSGLTPSASQQAALVAAYRVEQLAALEAQQRQFERVQRAAVEAVSRQSSVTHPSLQRQTSISGRESTSSVDSSDVICPTKRLRTSSFSSSVNANTNNHAISSNTMNNANSNHNNTNDETSTSISCNNLINDRLFANLPSAHLKITSRGYLSRLSFVVAITLSLVIFGVMS
ncbi:unnamed protein product [Anisakis simplex]|uniref:Protein dead ringer (inferred by orthology to a D. melanogaster protein) n=1 Tax=Anisakis simplex TaxID=6269 RepID=A0A0M3J7C2_ANISI|nr:unnamed protein product [Anisakis simplex]